MPPTDIVIGAGYEPHTRQLAAHACGARYLQLLTGRRGGKTKWGGQETARRIYAVDLPANMGRPYDPGAFQPGTSMWWQRNPRLHYWVVSETYDLLDQAARELGLALPASVVEHQNAADRKWWLWPDILVEFKSAKDPKRLVGPGLNGIWLEESARMHRDAWTGYMRPLVSDKRKGWCISTTTPLGMDWTEDAFSKPAAQGEPDYAEFHWTFEDNPHNDPGEAEAARARLPPEYFEREYHASRKAFMGQIYQGWKDAYEFDTLPPGIQFSRILAGVDWGITNPGAIEVGGLDSRGHLWVFDEVYKASELVEDFWAPEMKRLMATHKFNEVVCDPAEPDNLFRFQRVGIHARGHRNWGSGKYDEHARSVLSGIRLVASLIHQGKLHISRRCRNLLREMRNYQWDRTPRGDFHERPASGQDDHACSALRYLATYAMKGPAAHGIE